jgi:hypothetical protein
LRMPFMATNMVPNAATRKTENADIYQIVRRADRVSGTSTFRLFHYVSKAANRMNYRKIKIPVDLLS